MATNAQYYQYNQNESIGPKKTVLVLATVVCCIGVLWMQIFSPMLFGGSDPSPKNRYMDAALGGK